MWMKVVALATNIGEHAAQVNKDSNVKGRGFVELRGKVGRQRDKQGVEKHHLCPLTWPLRNNGADWLVRTRKFLDSFGFLWNLQVPKLLSGQVGSGPERQENVI